MKMNKETLMKLDKEDLVNALIQMRENNLTLINALNNANATLKVIYPFTGNIAETMEKIRKDVKEIMRSTDDETIRNIKLQEYMKSCK